jgi:hypothetical protein
MWKKEIFRREAPTLETADTADMHWILQIETKFFDNRL